MSDTYRHKNKAKAHKGLVKWGRNIARCCTCEICTKNRKFFDTKKRKAAKQDLKNFE